MRRSMMIMVAMLAIVTVVTATPHHFRTSTGIYEGACQTGVCSALGIPFAQPPVGRNRWRAPQPLASFPSNHNDTINGLPVFKATATPVSCPQDGTRYNPTSEDCLVLNVFTPIQSANAAPVPVLVWTYGGSFIHGGINLFIYEASKMAANGIVVVAINYRLGALGFAYHDDLTKEDASYPTSGNYGIMDQQMALKWVQKNIAAFGGDASRVTLSGESAGSVITCFQMVIPSSVGLLHLAILQSGPCTQGTVGSLVSWSKQHMMDATLNMMKVLNCTTIACLRAVPPQTFIDKANSPWDPMIDGWLITDAPYKLYQQGKSLQIPILGGSVTDEGTMFIPNLVNMTDGAYRLALVAQLGLDIATKVYTQYPSSAYVSPGYAFARAYGDQIFTCPLRRLLTMRTSVTPSPFYVYRWDHVPSWVVCPGYWCPSVPLGAYHSSELFFQFGHPNVGQNFSASESTLSSAMMGAWTNFTATGNPRNGGLSQWIPWTPANDADLILDLDTSSSFVMESGWRKRGCDFWDSITS